MKKVLGLDLGTNSIGWAVVSMNDENQFLNDIKLGSRIIPMSQDEQSNFEKGATVSQTAQRTEFRSKRKLRQRNLQRRERMHRVLHLLGFLPAHYEKALGWDKGTKTYGKFIDNSEPKLAWERMEDGSHRFIFMSSFNEMIADFARHQPQMLTHNRKIPLDWTIYYLRKKALSQPIQKEELAWILLNFNQKRGYFQLRGEEEEENLTKKEELYELKVTAVEATDSRKGNNILYIVYLENGWIYKHSSKIPLDNWVGQTKSFTVTTEFNEDGRTPKKDKYGEDKRSIKLSKENDWGLIKKSTEKKLAASGLTVGAFIYEHLLENPTDKIRGKYVRTIEREHYKNELLKILNAQTAFHPELRSKAMLSACAEDLYPNNQSHRDNLQRKNMVYLLVDDLLFYQRPLKSKKHLIATCPYEHYEYVDKETGEVKRQHIRCIAKSNPYFQEFRLWQFIHNLRLYRREDDAEVTAEYLKTSEDYVRLFLYLNKQKEIKQDTILRGFLALKKSKAKDAPYPIRWNYVEDKVFPGNETLYEILSALDKADIEHSWLDKEGLIYRLWHLLYSVNDKQDLRRTLHKFHHSHYFIEALLKIKPFKKDYAAYSEKAIKKLLSVMRMGSIWREEDICNDTLTNINNIVAGQISPKLKEKMGTNIRFTSLNDFQGLPVWLACYVVYGRHSEVSEITKWNKPEDLATYIRNFKQHSLRNPIVERCVLEALRTVHDIWKEEGNIDEIHVELGRSMKKTAAERQNDMQHNMRNENTNLRIRYLLEELKNDVDIAEVRPYSPMQQEILRIYEEGALHNLYKDDEEYEDIIKISKQSKPSHSELIRYKLWLDQKYISPYTGKPISLSKLFTPAYEIEHIIPQSRFFDNSFTNKVICEAEVNHLKSNMLGYEFIKKHGGEIVHCTTLGDVTVLSESSYKELVNTNYANNQAKRKKLLLEDIPEDFIERQMNDSRYISKMVMSLLSNIVREDDEEEATSKHVVPCVGAITNQLKKDWGLNDVWNTLMKPRYERMNELTNTDLFGREEDKNGKTVFQTDMPLELRKNYSKKRIDHRHHAMDALVVACASRNIINYLNNVSANDTNRREDLRRLLCDKNRVIRKPWETFTQDAFVALENVVVSFKNNVRVLNKTTNYYQKYDASGKKKYVTQSGSNLWAIRKPMHKDTPFGVVNLKRKTEVSLNKALDNIPAICDKELKTYILNLIANKYNRKQLEAHFKSINYRLNRRDIKKVEVLSESNNTEPMVAKRKPLDNTFDKKRIESITDTGIQKILLNYLNDKGGDPDVAFTQEGIVEMNSNISKYNGGKWHQPIFRVRIYESKGKKYSIGENGVKAHQFVETKEGTNLYFAIYEDLQGKRTYKTIPLNEVVERLKQKLSPVPEKNDAGEPLKFYISPNDLVYVPSEEDKNKLFTKQDIDSSRIYKFINSSDTQANFVPHTIASVIYDVDKKNAQQFCKGGKIIQNELGLGSPQSKNQKAIDGQMIKEVCWKIETDRLGNILNIIK